MKILVLLHNLKQLTIRILFRCENIYWGAPCASLFYCLLSRKTGVAGALARWDAYLLSLATAGNGHKHLRADPCAALRHDIKKRRCVEAAAFRCSGRAPYSSSSSTYPFRRYLIFSTGFSFFFLCEDLFG